MIQRSVRKGWRESSRKCCSSLGRVLVGCCFSQTEKKVECRRLFSRINGATARRQHLDFSRPHTYSSVLHLNSRAASSGDERRRDWMKPLLSLDSFLLYTGCGFYTPRPALLPSLQGRTRLFSSSASGHIPRPLSNYQPHPRSSLSHLDKRQNN
jgi:hypothetical protein